MKTLKYDIMHIHTHILEAVLKNYAAYELVHRTDFSVRESITASSLLTTVSVKEQASLYGFDEKMITNILYAREIKKRFELEFNKIKKDIIHLEKKFAYQELENQTIEQLENILSGDDLFQNMNNILPFLDMYKVPGESKNPKNFILLFPVSLNDGFDYPVIKFLENEGFGGSVALRLRVGSDIAKLLYVLLQKKKVDGIINFYADSGAETYWYNFSRTILYGIVKNGWDSRGTKFENMLDKIPKNVYACEGGGFPAQEVRTSVLDPLKRK